MESRIRTARSGSSRSIYRAIRTTNRRRQNVRFTPGSEEAFLIGRRAGRDSKITYEFVARGACAEKRMSFRCLSRRHLSVDFRRVRERFEFLGTRCRPGLLHLTPKILIHPFMSCPSHAAIRPPLQRDLHLRFSVLWRHVARATRRNCEEGKSLIHRCPRRTLGFGRLNRTSCGKCRFLIREQPCRHCWAW
jgi:hypothetical protein